MLAEVFSYPASKAETVRERLAELGKQHTFAIIPDGKFLLGRSLLWQEEANKVLSKQMETSLPSIETQLLAKIAKDRPEIAAKDVALYCERVCRSF